MHVDKLFQAKWHAPPFNSIFTLPLRNAIWPYLASIRIGYSVCGSHHPQDALRYRRASGKHRAAWLCALFTSSFLCVQDEKHRTVLKVWLLQPYLLLYSICVFHTVHAQAEGYRGILRRAPGQETLVSAGHLRTTAKISRSLIVLLSGSKLVMF